MADKAIVAQYSPGDVVRFAEINVTTPIDYYGGWVVLRVLADGSLLLKDSGGTRRVASPEEVRR